MSPIMTPGDAWRSLGKDYEDRAPWLISVEQRVVMGLCSTCGTVDERIGDPSDAYNAEDHLNRVYGMDNRASLYWWPRSMGNPESYDDRAMACYLLAELVDERNDVLDGPQFPLPPLTPEDTP